MIYPDNFESKIGFDRIKSQIKALCVTQGAADKLSEAEFSNDYDTVVRRLEQTYEMRTALMLESGFPDGSFVDTEPFLKKAAVIGAFLDVEEIVALRKGLSTVHALVAFFGGREDEKYPRLRELCRDVSGFPAIINHIDSIVDKFGRIRDNASAELFAVRRTIREREGQASRRLLQIMGAAQASGLVDADASVSVRDGRAVIPVSAANKRKIKGFVHDESATGKTVYIEPVEVVEINNELKELQYEERREIVRILTRFTDAIRPDLPDIRRSGDFLTTMDFIRAKARFALANDCTMPIVERAPQIGLKNARHTLLAQTLRREGKPIVPLDFDGVTLKLKVPNESYVYHIEKHFIPLLKPIIHQLFGLKTKLRYAVPKTEPAAVTVVGDADMTAINKFVAQSDTTNIKNPFVIPGIRRLVIDPQLNPNYTFDTFVEGACNRLCRSAGLAVAVDPGRTPFNPLYIYGDSGLGKTHIAQAIGMEVKQRKPQLQVLYVSMNKFQAQFQNAAIKGELNDFIHFYQMLDVLIIDDIQELAGKDKTQNAFFNIFNHLHLSNKQLVMTSDKPPVELKDIEQRLITRFKWGLSTQLLLPDFETKVKIVQGKARKLGAEVPQEVIEFLAENINANVREIEGALSSLVANASFLGRKITTSLAKEILKAYVQLYQKEITIEHIIEVVCGYLALDPERFNSPERTREIAQARQIAMYLAKQHTKAPLTTIGSAIGGRNHATVLHSCKAVTNLIETDKAFRRQVEEIEKQVLA